MKINTLLKRLWLRPSPKSSTANEKSEQPLQLGNNSFLATPMQIDGGKFIYLGNNSSIGHSAWLGAFEKYLDQTFSPKILIEENVRIGNYACITCVEKITISKGCLISEFVYISDHYHGFDPEFHLSPALQPLYVKGEVFIGENTFIGYRVSILSGVKIGKNCVIGAHSVVTKSFPDYSMLAGSPAVMIKTYSFIEKNWIDV